MPASKEVTSLDFDKCVHNVSNKPMEEEQMSLRNYNHRIYTVKSNKTVIRNPN